MGSDDNSVGVLHWAPVATAGVLPAACGLVAAGTGSAVELGEVVTVVIIALVFMVIEAVIRTGPTAVQRRPHLFRLSVAVVLLAGLTTSGAVGPP